MSKTHPLDRQYTREHEWVKQDNGIATVGITDHAQHQLGDVVYLELPSPGTQVEQHKVFGVVESVKAVSDLFAPVSGEVLEVNEALVNSPETINRDPHENAWMIRIKMSDSSQLDDLLSAKSYDTYLSEHVK